MSRKSIWTIRHVANECDIIADKKKGIFKTSIVFDVVKGRSDSTMSIREFDKQSERQRVIKTKIGGAICLRESS